MRGMDKYIEIIVKCNIAGTTEHFRSDTLVHATMQTNRSKDS